MKINAMGTIIDSKTLPKPMQRQIRRARVKRSLIPLVRMATVALIVDLTLRAIL